MSNPDRSKESRQRLYTAIEGAMQVFPDTRVAQLLVNAAPTVDIFHFEDDQLAALINSYVAQHKRNKPDGKQDPA